MAAELAHDPVPPGACVAVDRVGNVAQAVARHRRGNRLLQALARHLQQRCHVRSNGPDRQREGGVAEAAAAVHTAVDPNDVAVRQPPPAGDAVDHLLVDGHAQRRRVIQITQERRPRAARLYVRPGDMVELGRGDTRLHPFGDQPQRLRKDACRFANAGHVRFALQARHRRPIRVRRAACAARAARQPTRHARNRRATATAASCGHHAFPRAFTPPACVRRRARR